MKFNEKTITLLQNFSTINQSMIFNPGNRISTVSNGKSMVAYADVETEFDRKFGIYNLGQFLNVISFKEDQEFEILDKKIKVSKTNDDGFSYTLTDVSMIEPAPEKVKFPTDAEVEFKLGAESLKDVMKASAMLMLPHVAFVGDRENIFMETLDVGNDSCNKYRVKVGETSNKFTMVFKTETLLILPDSYDIAISSKGIAKFSNETVTYYISTERKPSSYEE